jgi:hypothetical protein
MRVSARVAANAWRCRLLWTLLLGALAQGCDLPIAAPSWLTEWVLPGSSTTIAADELLPDAISVGGDGAWFQVEIPDTTVTIELGEICGSLCTSLQGMTAPKPGISDDFDASIELPSQVLSADLIAGTLVMRLKNGLAFDPIRPASGVFGSFSVTVRSAARTVASTVVDGKTTAFGSGSTLTRTLALAPGVLSGPFEVTVHVESPQGDRVRIDTKQKIEMAATLNDVRVGEVRVSLPEQSFTGTHVTFGTGDLDAAILQRIRAGALRIHMDNPLAVRGRLQIDIDAAGTRIERELSFEGPGKSTLVTTLDAEEVRRILDAQSVDVSVAGTVAGTAATTVVRPFIGIPLRIEVVLELAYTPGG